MIHAPFQCPLCAATSYSPTDKKEGYCGRCKAFTAEPILTGYTVYENPIDWPGGYVVRRWRTFSGLPNPVLDREAVRCRTLEQARASLPQGLYCLGRQPGDDKAILEVWI